MTAQTSILNNGGFTLIEVMVAMVIMLVGILGLLEAVNVATMQNLNNQLRNEAVLVGEDYMGDLLRRPTFENLSVGGLVNSYDFAQRNATSKIRGQVGSYMVDRKVAKMGQNSAELTVKVGWQLKKSQYFHEVHAVKSIF